MLKRLRRGLSLLEMMVVIGILAVVAVIALINMHGANQTRDLDASQRQLAAIFKFAHDSAVQNNTWASVVMSTSAPFTAKIFCPCVTPSISPAPASYPTTPIKDFDGTNDVVLDPGSQATVIYQNNGSIIQPGQTTTPLAAAVDTSGNYSGGGVIPPSGSGSLSPVTITLNGTVNGTKSIKIDIRSGTAVMQ